MSKSITFRHVPRVPHGRPSYWVHDETGVMLVRGIDDGSTQWQIWTAQMDKPLGTANTLNEAKAHARWVIIERKEWLA